MPSKLDQRSIDQMLARAEDHERRARLLRDAIAEMNEPAPIGRQTSSATLLKQAVALRKSQQPTPQPQTTHARTPEETETAIREALATGITTSVALGAKLGLSQPTISRYLAKLKRAKVVHMVQGGGAGKSFTWHLTAKAAKAPRHPKAATSHRKRDYIIAALRVADHPLSSKELSAAVRHAGYRGPLSGIHNYVKQGMLTSSKNGSGTVYALGPQAEAVA